MHYKRLTHLIVFEFSLKIFIPYLDFNIFFFLQKTKLLHSSRFYENIKKIFCNMFLIFQNKYVILLLYRLPLSYNSGLESSTQRYISDQTLTRTQLVSNQYLSRNFIKKIIRVFLYGTLIIN